MSDRSGKVTPDHRRMLEAMLERPGKALTPDQLIDAMMSERPDAPRPSPVTVRVQISHLRAALRGEVEIGTIWGKGYFATRKDAA